MRLRRLRPWGRRKHGTSSWSQILPSSDDALDVLRPTLPPPALPPLPLPADPIQYSTERYPS
eukprot:1252739-Pyramimonas_sp.AAC.1